MEAYEVKKDCFGYRGKCKCDALKWTYCTEEECKFYKTKKQFEKDREKYPYVSTSC